jgi:hypothetical protein
VTTIYLPRQPKVAWQTRVPRPRPNCNRLCSDCERLFQLLTKQLLLFRSTKGNKGPNAAQLRSLYRGDCPHFPVPFAPGFTDTGGRSKKGMKRLITAVGLMWLFACQAFAGEHAALARVTTYWPGEGSGANAAWNGARLNEGHCAVSPKKIPYGSKVVFHDAECLAVDTGPHVVNRKAARLCGRNPSERNAIVVDRFFDTREKALAWAKANPHFMVVRVRTPDTEAAY